jgi:hypothetical protein
MKNHTIYKHEEGEKIITRFYEKYLETLEGDFEIIPNLKGFESSDMGHFPSEEHLLNINQVILDFLQSNY